MKHITAKSVTLILLMTSGFAATATAQSTTPRFRHVTTEQSRAAERELASRRLAGIKAAVAKGDTVTADTIEVRTASQIIFDTEVSPDIPTFNRLAAPWVFSQYRDLAPKELFRIPTYEEIAEELWRNTPVMFDDEQDLSFLFDTDPATERKRAHDVLRGINSAADTIGFRDDFISLDEPDIPSIMGNARPAWLQNAADAWNMQEDMMYRMMVDHPQYIEYAYWRLPIPPRLPDEDKSVKGMLNRVHKADVNVSDAVISEYEIGKKHWLHVLNGGLQFSQAYLSENWYQGGNNYLALLINFLWDVQLNNVYHPKLLFQSTVSYKLGLNSVEDDQYHKYSISQDLFQYNMKFGYKAASNWYYSLTAQFKTQLLNNYTKNTQTRIASFLTPGDLTVGLGMTYSKQNKKKTFQFNASISPLSYNLKTAIDDKVKHSTFGMGETQKCKSEFGSNAEITLNWQPVKNISYRTRLFAFTDYKKGLGDWENTINFQFNKYFSTQLYVNMRYDSSAPPVYIKLKDKDGNVMKDENGNEMTKKSKWTKFMLKEILSVGLSYTFSTK